jgi:hypothetical protein
MISTMLRRVAYWLRYAGTDEFILHKLTDEVERALAGERPRSPIHRYRERLTSELPVGPVLLVAGNSRRVLEGPEFLLD